jgi:hypothetical protein
VLITFFQGKHDPRLGNGYLLDGLVLCGMTQNDWKARGANCRVDRLGGRSSFVDLTTLTRVRGNSTHRQPAARAKKKAESLFTFLTTAGSQCISRTIFHLPSFRRHLLCSALSFDTGRESGRSSRSSPGVTAPTSSVSVVHIPVHQWGKFTGHPGSGRLDPHQVVVDPSRWKGSYATCLCFGSGSEG